MTPASCVTLAVLAFSLCVPLPSQSPKQTAGSDKQNQSHIEMANVLFRYSPDLSVFVVRLRGILLPTEGHTVLSLDDPSSFLLATDAGEVHMTTAQLAGLMNSWLLRSPSAEIKNVRIAVSGNQLLIDGTMKKGLHVPFHAKADVSLTQDNRIRVSLQQVKTAHLPVERILNAMGLNLADLVSQKGLKGMSVEGDSFLVDLQSAFPPPQLRARIASVRISGQGVVVVFGQGAPNLPNPPARNYIAVRGGTIEYGREEMFDADLTVIDSTPADPLEFDLPHFWCQMVEGDIKVTLDHAVRIRTPDYSKLRPGTCHE